jgi:hypothetical protein
MDESTTDASVQEQAPTQVQPEEQHAEAEQTPTSEPTTATTNDDASAPSEPVQADNSESVDPAEFWAKKGIDVSTPEGLAKATKSYQEAEKRMHQTAQQSSELEKQLVSQPPTVSDDPLVQELANEVFQIRQTQEAREFIRENNVSDTQRTQFVQWLQANPTKQQLVDNGFMTVSEAYQLSGIGRPDATALRDEGSKATLERLASNQTAAAVPGNAVTSAAPQQLTAANAEAWWTSLGAAGRKDPANKAKLDSVLGG